MRKLSIVFTLSYFVCPAMSYAIEACGNKVTANRNHAVQTVTCAECRTFADFGMFGGALLSQTSLISIPVENNNGVKAVVSIQRYISHPTGANISRSILRWLDIQIDLPDPDRSAITVDTINGYIFGARWDGRRTLDRSLEAKCEQIKLEKEAKEKVKRERQRGTIIEGPYDTDAFWQSGNPYGLYGLSRYRRGKGPRTIVTTESCGTEACPSWGTTEFVRSGVFAQYIRYEAPRERETIVTTYSIRGGGSGSGSGGSAVAPGGNAAARLGTEKEK